MPTWWNGLDLALGRIVERSADRIVDAVQSVHGKLDRIGDLMSTVAQAIQGYDTLVDDLVSQRDAAVSALLDANGRAAAAADALKKFQDDDAATDATQIAAQADADALAISSALTAAQKRAAQTPATPEPPTEVPVDTPAAPSTPAAPGEPVADPATGTLVDPPTAVDGTGVTVNDPSGAEPTATGDFAPSDQPTA